MYLCTLEVCEVAHAALAPMKRKTDMKYNAYTSKSLKISDLKFIGGGKTLNISVLRRSLIPHFVLIIVSFLCFACSKKTSVSQYPEMQGYFAESCNLGVATTDSVQRFTQKFDAFVAQHTDAADDPLYARICDNIQNACARLNITVNDDWDGENHLNF